MTLGFRAFKRRLTHKQFGGLQVLPSGGSLVFWGLCSGSILRAWGIFWAQGFEG